MNKLILSGRIGKDAEAVKIGENTLLKFPFATSKKWKNKAGEKQEKTQWHNIVIWRKEGLLNYLKKGTQLVLTGEVEYSENEKDGKKTYFTNINVNEVEFIGSKNDNQQSKPSQENKTYANVPEGDDGELPF